MPRRKRQRRDDAYWTRPPPRKLGLETAGLWIASVLLWLRVAVWLYNGAVLGKHDHMHALFPFGAVLVTGLAIPLTIEWRRMRKKIPS